MCCKDFRSHISSKPRLFLICLCSLALKLGLAQVSLDIAGISWPHRQNLDNMQQWDNIYHQQNIDTMQWCLLRLVCLLAGCTLLTALPNICRKMRYLNLRVCNKSWAWQKDWIQPLATQIKGSRDRVSSPSSQYHTSYRSEQTRGRPRDTKHWLANDSWTPGLQRITGSSVRPQRTMQGYVGVLRTTFTLFYELAVFFVLLFNLRAIF